MTKRNKERVRPEIVELKKEGLRRAMTMLSDALKSGQVVRRPGPTVQARKALAD
jgi:hypothetical protein